MNWYLTKIIYRIVCGNGNHTPQFDEQLRLVNAENKELAFFKAQEIGKKEEEHFYNNKKEMVSWQFINVAEVYRLGEMIDGAELYSRIEEREDGDDYINMINKKAGGILQSDSHQILQLA
jgi:uncharacterized Rmd1/YagE family protein